LPDKSCACALHPLVLRQNGVRMLQLSFDNLVVSPYPGARMTRPVHPKKEIEEALRYAQANGWTVKVGGAHAWGRLYCPYNDAECRCGDFCIVGIWSTPKNAGNHVRALRRVVDHCTTHQLNVRQ